MGNEESQQAGGPQQGPGAPMGMGTQQPPRFGGPPGGMTRPPAGMMGPPGGAGPPRGPPGGGGPMGVMGRPFAPQQQQPPPRQVGVQPWAEPPVPQPQRFRGPGSAPPMQQQQQAPPRSVAGGSVGPRPLSAVQQQQQQIQQQQQQAAAMKLAEEEAGLDLSDLSEAEKAKILSVMARAQDLDQDYERHKRAKDEGGPAAVRLLCPLCQRADLAVETNKMCGDCGKDFCQKCGTFVPGEGRRSVWVCNTCSNRRKQQQESGLTQGQKGVDGGTQRKDEAMTSSREYHLHPPSLDDVDISPLPGDEEDDEPHHQYYHLGEEDEDEEEDEWGGGSPDSRLLDDDMGLDEDEGTATTSYYDRSPGEVYTIPEEEDEDATSPLTWDVGGGGHLNPDTASSLLRWRGMGQPFQQQQNQQLQQQSLQPQQPQPMMGIQQPQQPSVSLIGGVSTGGGTSLIGGVASSGGSPFVSGSLIPSVGGGGRGTIPGTVPLTALSQAPNNNNNTGWNTTTVQQQQQPQTIQQQQQMLMQHVTQGGMQQQQQQPQLQQQALQTTTMMMQHQQPMQQSTMVMPQPMQQQQLNKQQSRTQQLQTKDEWSELSPILDVSPSFEAAEEELMEKCQQQGGGGIPRATSGTISGMLADFNRALGLAATPTQEETRPLTGGHAQLQVPQHQPMGGATTTTIVSNTVMAPPLGSSSTEMDQNQNLVQQQFQLQQQQLMIQQQQQVIAQQQQQLQQQMQFSSNAANIAQQQQEQQQAITVQQQQTQAMTQQQQTQQQQPQSQRKVRGRLPQPAMDQMHAAIAAQTPGSKSARGYAQRPVSPVLSSSTRPHDGALLGVTPAPNTSALISPSARRDLEMGSSSGKVRRRLPPVPLDQEPASASPLLRSKKAALPLSASCGGGATGWGSSTHKHHRRTPQRTTSLDDGMALASSDLDFLRGLPSSSADSYLQLLTSSTSTATVTPPAKSVLDSIPSSIGMAGTGSLLVRRDLSAPHSLSSYLRGGVGSFLDPSASSRLPSYLVNLKQQLREELRSVTDIHRRRITDPDLSGLLSQWAGPSTDPLLLRSSPLPLPATTRLSTTTPAAIRRARHRRHASDTKLGTSSFLRDDAYGDDPLYRYNKFNMPFKSYEFESIDDHLRGGDFSGVYGSSAYTRGSSLLPLPRGGTYRRSSLTDAPPITLRDTPLASKSLDVRRYNRDMARLRRHTDIGLVSSALGLDPYGRSSGGVLGGGAMLGSRRSGMRSWHPSPYVSSEDEDEREEKKAKIKAEIARRKERLLMQTHDYRGGVGGGGLYEDRLYSSPLSLESGGSSRDEYDDYHHLLRRHPHASNTYPAAYGRRSHSVGGVGGSYGYPYDWGGEEDLPYDYTGYPDYSPLDNPLPMPLLPDMPTRSRKLLHELQHYPQQGDYAPTRTGGGGGGHHPSHHHQQQSYHHPDDDYRRPPLPPAQSSVDSRHSPRKAQQNPKGGQKYDFPVKRILLTRDPKDRSVSGNGLGMKVVGGKEIPGGRGEIGAYVARIYPGGVVETLGEVREGDQVLEWNGVCLTGKTYEEVQRIIASSGDEVEIVIRSDFNMLSQGPASTHPPATPPRRVTRGGDGGWGEQGNTRRDDYYHQGAQDEGGGGGMSPGRGQHRRGRQQRIVSPTHEKGDNAENKEKYRAENICGEIQLQVCHDSKVGILYVTIVRARNLVTSRDNSGLPDPYVICYLLPDRCFEHQRRTRYFSRCSRPEWKQTMVYPHVPAEDLRRRHLEVSVWNYDANGGPPEFLGEVIVDLKDTSVIDEQSRWYKLHPHDPKKYPCPPSAANHHPVKMARLNNPKILFDDDVRKQHTAA